MQTVQSDRVLTKRMGNIRLDLFKLHDENDKGQGRIKAVLNEELKNLLKQMVIDIRKTKKLKVKDIAKSVNLRYYEFWRCLNQCHIPLITLNKLVLLWLEITDGNVKNKMEDVTRNITLLSHGAGNTYKVVTVPRILTENLCKICGAIIADGHLKYRKTKNGCDYSIIVRDQYEDNLLLFTKWLKEEFGTIVRPAYDKNQRLWYIDFSNKIIFRYLNSIFEIPFGKKSNIVKIPKLIENSYDEYRKAFVVGVLMFDGGINYRNGYFDLSTKSEFLVKNIEHILRKFNIKPDYISKEIDKYSKVFELRIRRKKKLGRLLQLFIEPNTTKWEQLNTHVNGLNNFDNLFEIIMKLNALYPRIRDSITFEDVIKTIEKFKLVKVSDLTQKLDRKKTVIYEYLECLENWKILESHRIGLYKVWHINPNLK